MLQLAPSGGNHDDNIQAGKYNCLLGLPDSILCNEDAFTYLGMT